MTPYEQTIINAIKAWATDPFHTNDNDLIRAYEEYEQAVQHDHDVTAQIVAYLRKQADEPPYRILRHIAEQIESGAYKEYV